MPLEMRVRRARGGLTVFRQPYCWNCFEPAGQYAAAVDMNDVGLLAGVHGQDLCARIADVTVRDGGRGDRPGAETDLTSGPSSGIAPASDERTQWFNNLPI